MKRLLQVVLTLAILFAFLGIVIAQDYVGSSTCKTCHSTVYDDVFNSGHPHKLKKIEGAEPTYPEGTSAGIPNPPTGFTWNDITYVIGGYGWKARFIDSEGYILTGDTERQWNLANSELGLDAHWTDYDADKAPRKPYTCGSCHTTGWVATDENGPHQDDLPGIYGTWSEPGVTCEACHGPGSAHASAPSKDKNSKEENCSSCHIRGDVTQIDASGGLIKHHEQYEDLLASPHKAFQCGTCHEPHKSTKYEFGGFKGEDNTCKTCHSSIEIKVAAKTNFKCTSCHMPFTGKSAVAITIDYKNGQVPKGDIRSHIFRINPDTTWKFLTDDGKYVRVDDEQNAYLTLDFTCLTCHTNQDMEWAANNAEAIHGTGTAISVADASIPSDYALKQNFPNPFNPTTTISFDLPKASDVKLKVYTITGQLVGTLLDQRMPAGSHSLQLNGFDWASGVYIYTLQADNFHQSRKMILTK
ncbi:MAG: T9SS type A sorting domain-containing protein [Caldisericaceae bacterium]|nr:T9SS type A sorting domain-containing protein [Caldisericaceae bacterium]